MERGCTPSYPLPYNTYLLYLQPGMPELINWLRELQIIEHNPARKDFEISIGVGSQDLMTKVR